MSVMAEHDYFRKEVRGQGNSDPKMIRDTSPSQDTSTHKMWDFYHN